MENILYEVSYNFSFFLLIPLIMLLVIPFLPKLWKNKYDGEKTIIDYKTVKIFCSFGFAFILFITVITVFFEISSYNKIVGAYKSGDYEIVEGFVEDFKPMPYEGHSDESFEINGVKFSYSDYSIGTGYNNAKSHGGVITGNGQHLKIGYIKELNGNVIVYIEQLP